mgnify:CR=1 FL=1
MNLIDKIRKNMTSISIATSFLGIMSYGAYSGLNSELYSVRNNEHIATVISAPGMTPIVDFWNNDGKHEGRCYGKVPFSYTENLKFGFEEIANLCKLSKSESHIHKINNYEPRHIYDRIKNNI